MTIDERGDRRRWAWVPSSMISPNPDHRPPGSVGGRPFRSTEHLSTEAVAAYVDGELPMAAFQRADEHLIRCPQCRAEVDAQRAASTRLRQSGEITIPASLLGQLSRIPQEASRGHLDAPGFPVLPADQRNRRRGR